MCNSKILARVTKEAESHDLPSATWRVPSPGEPVLQFKGLRPCEPVIGDIASRSEGLRSRTVKGRGRSSPSPEVRKS